MSAVEYLPNPFFAALLSADEPFGLVHGVARRFQPGTIPFAGLPEPSAAGFADLLAMLEPGEKIYITVGAKEKIELCEGIEELRHFAGLQMRYCALAPEADDRAVVPLALEQTGEMLELKGRAFPGYFGVRAPELGQFFGVRDAESGRLVAMAGERLATFDVREISAVCTDPAYTGKGHAARVVRAVLRHQAGLGVESILHVAAENRRAISLYERLGFRASGAIEFIKLRRVPE